MSAVCTLPSGKPRRAWRTLPELLLVVALCAAVPIAGAAGCRAPKADEWTADGGQDSGDPVAARFRSALPTAALLAVVVPGYDPRTGGAGTDSATDAGAPGEAGDGDLPPEGGPEPPGANWKPGPSPGKPASFLRAGWEASYHLWQAARPLVEVVSELSAGPGKAVSDTIRQWGPLTPKGARDSFSLIVTRVGDGAYQWRLEHGKARTPVMGGSILRDASGAGRGKGSLAINYSMTGGDPWAGGRAGNLQVSFDTNAEHHYLDYALADYTAPDGATFPGEKYLLRSRGRFGTLDFVTARDTEDQHPNPERLVVRLRWQENEAGRADVLASQGDLRHPARTEGSMITECWAVGLAQVYFRSDLATFPTVSGSRSLCVYPTRSCPALLATGEVCTD